MLQTSSIFDVLFFTALAINVLSSQIFFSRLKVSNVSILTPVNGLRQSNNKMSTVYKTSHKGISHIFFFMHIAIQESDVEQGRSTHAELFSYSMSC